MSDEKIIEIIKRIYNKTNEGLIEWEPTERSIDYQVSFSNYSIRMSIATRSDGDYDYIIKIINDYGDIIEEVNDEDIANSLPDSYEIMKSIYELARRKAMGVDNALDSILKDLGSS